MDKQQVIAELRRVAELLQTSSLTKQQLSQNSHMSMTTVRYTYGTWKEALEAAGLIPIVQGEHLRGRQPTVSEETYLQEIIRLTQELGHQPTEAQLNAHGHYSITPYRRRWGSLAQACKVAYAKYGFPTPNENAHTDEQAQQPPSAAYQSPMVIPETYKPQELKQRKKVQFGEAIDFRGLHFAPINEQGVVYIFGMVALELGFLIESIRTEYPDCEGKRSVDQKRQRWEHVRIEFEYQSSNFRQHGHNPDECDLIVCWIHDWQECPLEVLELRSQITYLPNR